MSHFAVLVIGDNVEQQLQPYHEFECTGINDQYVQDIDETEEKLAEVKSDTRTMVKMPDGALLPNLDPSFFRDPTDAEAKDMGPIAGTGWSGGKFHMSKDWGDGRGYRAKIHELPAGAEKVEVPFPSFASWCEYHEARVVPFGEKPDLEGAHKYGYVTVDEAGEPVKFINRTNKNAKWDWWVEGGRWGDWLKLKDGRRADSARKGDIDFESMRDEAGAKAAADWDKAATATGGQTWLSWVHMRDVEHNGDIDAAREAYKAQPAVAALKPLFDHPFHDKDQYLTPRDQFIQQARDRATVLYAVVKDSVWSVKGEMGWFGMSSGDMDQNEWNRKVNELLDGLPDDTLITVVDCHI